MPKFQEIIKEQSALRFVYDKLDIKSSIGRQLLLSQELITKPEQLIKQIQELEEIVNIISCSKLTSKINKFHNIISETRNISQTIENISNSYIADDIQLFEIKHFAVLSESISKYINELNISFIELRNLEPVVDILDPDKQGIPHFYIYSSYSKELAEYRKKLEVYQKTEDHDKAEKYRLLCGEAEDKIRKELSESLNNYCSKLSENLNKIAFIDTLIAKAKLANELNLCKPLVSKNKTIYQALWNPFTDYLLGINGKKFQPVDISIKNEPYLITGANMTGKTILLKTVALAQYMFQFGFFIPADKAEIEPVDILMMNIGESDTETTGLSSFAAEILKINEIVDSVKNNQNIIVLVDELARTTNPDEGKAFVSAFIDILTQNNIKGLVTTHYSGIKSKCRKLRVKGLSEKTTAEKITINNINDFIDYSLIEVLDDEVPAEAIKIAEILNVNKQYLEMVKKSYKLC